MATETKMSSWLKVHGSATKDIVVLHWIIGSVILEHKKIHNSSVFMTVNHAYLKSSLPSLVRFLQNTRDTSQVEFEVQEEVGAWIESPL